MRSDVRLPPCRAHRKSDQELARAAGRSPPRRADFAGSSRGCEARSRSGGANICTDKVTRARCYNRAMTTAPTPAPTLVTAAVQMNATDDVAANLAVVRRLGAEAAAGGAKLIVLPECFAFLGRGERDKMAIAESLDGAPGPILGALAELAAKHGVF